MRFSNQTALVTGASGGIGGAIAAALHKEGAAVCLVGRSQERLSASLPDADGSGARYYEADLTHDADLDNLAHRLSRDLDGLDILVHCAATISLGLFECAPVEQFDRQYRLNVRAPYVLTQALLPLLKQSRGQVVFLNSTAGLKANAKASQYSATKHALKALADSLRDEVNEQGIRVLSVFAGRTSTSMQRTVMNYEGKPWKPERLLQPSDIAGLVTNALSMPRSGELMDLVVRPMSKY